MTQRVPINIVDSTGVDGDGGYYAEVWEVGTGRDLYQSEVFATPEEARQQALAWVEVFVTEWR